MHIARLRRLLTVLEHPDDRPLDPVVSAMPASDGGLRSLDVAVVGAAVVAIEIPACSETPSSNACKGLEGLEWCPLS